MLENAQKKIKEDNTFELQVNIVKHIVEVKLQEADEKKNVAEKRAQKKKLLEVLATKKDQELLNKTPEELQKMIDEM